MFQHDSTLFNSSFVFFSWMLKQNWNSFLFQRQRLMQVNLHVCRLIAAVSYSDELMGFNRSPLDNGEDIESLCAASLFSREFCGMAKCEVNKKQLDWISLHARASGAQQQAMPSKENRISAVCRSELFSNSAAFCSSAVNFDLLRKFPSFIWAIAQLHPASNSYLSYQRQNKHADFVGEEKSFPGATVCVCVHERVDSPGKSICDWFAAIKWLSMFNSKATAGNESTLESCRVNHHLAWITPRWSAVKEPSAFSLRTMWVTGMNDSRQWPVATTRIILHYARNGLERQSNSKEISFRCQQQKWPVALPAPRIVVSFPPFVADQWSGALRYLLNEKTMERKKLEIKIKFLMNFFSWAKEKKEMKRSRRS
jgi:hypothetical protein